MHKIVPGGAGVQTAATKYRGRWPNCGETIAVRASICCDLQLWAQLKRRESGTSHHVTRFKPKIPSSQPPIKAIEGSLRLGGAGPLITAWEILVLVGPNYSLSQWNPTRQHCDQHTVLEDKVMVKRGERVKSRKPENRIAEPDVNVGERRTGIV